MTAQQAAAGSGLESNRHAHRGQRGRRSAHRDEYRHGDYRDLRAGYDSDGRGRGCRRGPIDGTIRGIAEKFGIPRKGVLIAWIVCLVFSFPVGVALFVLAWVYVHHPEWFEGLRNMLRGGRGSYGERGSGRSVGNRSGDASEGAAEPWGADFEEPWMEELRKKFDDLEHRTDDMEGYVASGDYRLASELECMRKEDAPAEEDAPQGATGTA